MLTIGRGQHGSTYGGNPVAAKVAVAALQVLLEEKLPQRADEMGQLFREELQNLQRSSERVTTVGAQIQCQITAVLLGAIIRVEVVWKVWHANASLCRKQSSAYSRAGSAEVTLVVVGRIISSQSCSCSV